jgi:hypothetical protein
MKWIESRTDRRGRHRHVGMVSGAAIVVLAFCLTAAARADSFRCGTQLVQTGDRKYDVVGKCGEPAFRDTAPGTYLPGIGPVDVIETWYYNPGPGRLLRVLTFHRGMLTAIRTGGRGFDERSVQGSCQPNRIIPGMSKYELLSRCGPPVAHDIWLEHSGPRPYWRGHGAVLVEEWTYEFGSNRFVRHLRIVNGRVARITTGGRGR